MLKIIKNRNSPEISQDFMERLCWWDIPLIFMPPYDLAKSLWMAMKDSGAEDPFVNGLTRIKR